MAIVFDWLTVSTTTGSADGTGQFWLRSLTTTPISAMAVVASQIAAWDIATFPSLAVTAGKTGTNEVTVPAGTTHVRVDLELPVTAKGVTKIGLTIRQLFSVNAQGALLPQEHSLDDRPWVASPRGAVRGAAAGPVGRRRILGLHPLMQAVPTGFTIDCRFL